MKDYIITTDTTSDLPSEYIAKHGITIIPLCYMIKDEVYGSGKEMDIKDFYSLMRSGTMPTTMACVPNQVHDIFEGFIKKGYDILHISFSSALSSSYNNSVMVANELMEQYPDSKINVVDSLCASMGEGLLVHKAVIKKEAGASLDEVTTWLEDHKLNLCHQFTVDSLFHLHRGGRVSKATAIVGTLINVKPVLHVDNEGRLIPLCNVRGRKKSLTTLVDNMAKSLEGYTGENDDIFIGHGDCLEDAMYVGSLIKERFGIDNITYNYISPTIGTHSGPGTVALFFMGNTR